MPKNTPDKTAALRQQRRRDRLKELQARKVAVLLNKEQVDRLDSLLVSGYASDRSAVLAKGMDEAFERLNGDDICSAEGIVQI